MGLKKILQNIDVTAEYPALPTIRKTRRFRTSKAPSSLCSNSSQVEIHAAIAMTFSIVHEIPSAPRPAKEKHVPFLSIKQPGSGGRRQTMPGHYRLPGLLLRHSLFVLTPVSKFVFTGVCVRACNPHICSFPPRSPALNNFNIRGTYVCAWGMRMKGEKYVTWGGKEGKVVGLPFQN